MANFNPDMLLLAREASGLTQKELASRVEVTQSFLSKIENGHQEPDDDTLASLASALGVRPRFFMRRDERRGLPVSFFRKRKTTPKRDITLVESYYNLARMDLERLLSGLRLKEDLPVPDMSTVEHGPPEVIAEKVRAYAQVPSGPVRHMIQLLERMRIFVIPLSGRPQQADTGTVADQPELPRKIDAMSVPAHDGAPPMIFFNPGRPMDRIRFSLAHELGHLVMHRLPHEDMEAEADAFAASFLLPADEISPFFERHERITLKNLIQLKPQWRVSVASLIERAHQLGYVTDNQRTYLYRQYNARQMGRGEPFEPPRETPKLMKEMFEAYRDHLGFSLEQLAGYLDVYTDAFLRRYFEILGPLDQWPDDRTSRLRVVE